MNNYHHSFTIDEIVADVKTNLNLTKYLYGIGYEPDPAEADLYFDAIIKSNDVASFMYILNHNDYMKNENGKVDDGFIFSIISADNLDLFKIIYEGDEERINQIVFDAEVNISLKILKYVITQNPEVIRIHNTNRIIHTAYTFDNLEVLKYLKSLNVVIFPTNERFMRLIKYQKSDIIKYLFDIEDNQALFNIVEEAGLQHIFKTNIDEILKIFDERTNILSRISDKNKYIIRYNEDIHTSPNITKYILSKGYKFYGGFNNAITDFHNYELTHISRNIPEYILLQLVTDNLKTKTYIPYLGQNNKTIGKFIL